MIKAYAYLVESLGAVPRLFDSMGVHYPQINTFNQAESKEQSEARKGTVHPTSQCRGSRWYPLSNKVLSKVRKGTVHPTSQCRGSRWHRSEKMLHAAYFQHETQLAFYTFIDCDDHTVLCLTVSLRNQN